jgi:hypothetical protein
MMRQSEPPVSKIVFLDADAAFRTSPVSVYGNHGDIWAAQKFFERAKNDHSFRYPYLSISEAVSSSCLEQDFRSRFGVVMSEWDGDAVARLSEVLREQNAKFVLTSSLRECMGRDAIAALFSYHGLDERFHDITPTPAPLFLQRFDRSLVEGASPHGYLKRYVQTMHDLWIKVNEATGGVVRHRALEILEYLDRHPEITSFTVVDGDDLSLGIGKKCMVKCNGPFSPRDATRLSKCLADASEVPRLPATCRTPALDLFRSSCIPCLYRRWCDPMASGMGYF